MVPLPAAAICRDDDHVSSPLSTSSTSSALFLDLEATVAIAGPSLFEENSVTNATINEGGGAVYFGVRGQQSTSSFSLAGYVKEWMLAVLAGRQDGKRDRKRTAGVAPLTVHRRFF